MNREDICQSCVGAFCTAGPFCVGFSNVPEPRRILQFGYRVATELPPDAPVIDCRCISNPFARAKTDAERYALVRADPLFETLVLRVGRALLKHPVVAVGCGYGKHRSGAVVEEVVKRAAYPIAVEKRGTT